MEIIVIRHGIALDGDEAHAMGLSDAERPLTAKGQRRTRAAAAGLYAVLGSTPIDALITSPLLRARETAELLAGGLGDPPVDETDALAPPVDMAALDTFLHSHFGDRRLVLVGHEPDLATWVSWSLTRRRDRLMAFKKAGAALLEFPGSPEGGTGTLRWLLTAGQLRALG
ncbi:SixA phosphatase family protein [Salinisphaera orenii]|uniref:Phosphohistidine phosphatase n=1 Tax=Salinisphaera orenii YIM 95161 TaxID=1051139 RepID=A0A423Q2W6_9GAMM|nr:histidine phosphatase family protein [Salinisphaera halophila]ROO33011.1 phosphohistidine phosphatase [Salinisphaera halophila YIM 95161]